MDTRSALLRLLSDGRFHSGARLGAALGIGRSAVWKHVRALGRGDLEIHAVPGRGYRLAAPLELLDEARILEHLPSSSRRRLAGLEVLGETDSTNRRLLARAACCAAPHACLAEYQHAGRGRLGRRWVTPYGRAICLSLLWRFGAPPPVLGCLGLAAGVAVIRALRSLGLTEGGLKWPNDIVWRQAKLGGILVEAAAENHGACHAVIGVGINVSMPPDAGRSVSQPWTDLESALGHRPSRNEGAALIIHHLMEVMAAFEAEGFSALAREWRSHDALRDRWVEVRQGDRTSHGIARGIDDQGALCVEGDDGMRRFLSGDVSLRATKP